MRLFIIVWLGQLVSLLGSGLTIYGLDIWIYQHTGSITQYTILYLFTTLPLVLVSPLAGTLVDRWNRRWAMILSDSGAAIITLCLGYLLVTQRLELWHIYPLVTISSIFNAFQSPAYSAATTQLVSKEYLDRASGLTQLALAVSQIVSPTLAAFLLGVIQLQGIILIDLATFFFSLIVLLLVRFPEVQIVADSEAESISLLRDTALGWSYLTARPGLLGLVLFRATIAVFWRFANVLITPAILSFSTVTSLGIIGSVNGIGLVVGSLIVAIWEGPKRKMSTILGFMLLCGFSMILWGLRPSVLLLCIGSFIFYIGRSIAVSSIRVILQKKVALDYQGRIFGLQNALTQSALPIAAVGAGPLADRIFEPLMNTDSFLATSAGLIIGVGPGRGIGLLFIILGILVVFTTVLAYLYPRLRRLEDELPDIASDRVSSTTDETLTITEQVVNTI
ncbi:MFS transporter [Nostoc sp.]|uniref:MFS transporter n=1 Tax=Nostoc sp. TaxID=1180 RepID=UPI002FF9C986